MKFYVVSLFILFILFSCNDDTGNENTEHQELIYESLSAEADTINSRETTKIMAVAEGFQLSYYWSANAGSILGSGPEVSFASTPCQSGMAKITCKIKDGYNQSESKTLTVFVQ